MSDATEIVHISEVDTRGFVSVRIECSDCRFTTYVGARLEVARRRKSWIKDHTDQHKPGRAIDIEVDWEPSARCSVCEDEIGNIVQRDEGLVCDECGATWDLDGKGGEIADD